VEAEFLSKESVVMRGPLSRQLPLLAVAAGVVLVAASPALAGVDRISAAGALVRYSPAVPVDATAEVEAAYDTAGDSTVTLRVRGLRPTTEYGAHVHVAQCGDSARAAGPDYQHLPNPDPDSPHDPAFENPGNEIWLDFETDGSGEAVVTKVLSWQFSPDRRAGSVIIHAERTRVGPDGPPGTAGARLACLTVGF
jgi:superoxide dismutase, Cu-Zn family